ncbi:hypothetical protein MJT46_015674 [Ovis ammon polii x Ovis aries]|nr:hypothetical protein MJT46_015674 [Ovis ammon polii x Ovis aries]
MVGAHSNHSKRLEESLGCSLENRRRREKVLTQSNDAEQWMNEYPNVLGYNKIVIIHIWIFIMNYYIYILVYKADQPITADDKPQLALPINNKIGEQTEDRKIPGESQHRPEQAVREPVGCSSPPTTGDVVAMQFRVQRFLRYVREDFQSADAVKIKLHFKDIDNEVVGL